VGNVNYLITSLAFPLRALRPLVLLFFISCAPVSYLENRQPTDLVFQKKVYGGVATLVGTELQAPGFSLYADGTVIYYQYMDGKRKLVFTRLSRSEFQITYAWIEKNVLRNIGATPSQHGAPVTELIFNGLTKKVEGLGFVRGSSALDSLNEFSKTVDQLAFKKNKIFISKKIVLYVKKLSSGDPSSWPEWNIKEIDLEKIYKKDLSFYEPNSDENSITVDGDLAQKVQKTIEQTSIYQKFSFKDHIFAVGYKPVLL
jgi:hypothetical protein